MSPTRVSRSSRWRQALPARISRPRPACRCGAESGAAVFLRDCWYVIAWDHEIAADALFSRVVLNEPLLVYRLADGRIVALEDRCCHRLAPLSAGRREGDCVRCGYHGLKFDADGTLHRSARAWTRCRRRRACAAIRWRCATSGSSSGWATRKRRRRAAARQLLLRPPGLAQQAGLPALRHRLPPDLRQPARLLAPELRAREDAGRQRRDRPGAGRDRADRSAASGSRGGCAMCRRHRSTNAFASSTTNLDRWFIYDFVLPGTLLMHSGGKPVGRRR